MCSKTESENCLSLIFFQFSAFRLSVSPYVRKEKENTFFYIFSDFGFLIFSVVLHTEGKGKQDKIENVKQKLKAESRKPIVF